MGSTAQLHSQSHIYLHFIANPTLLTHNTLSHIQSINPTNSLQVCQLITFGLAGELSVYLDLVVMTFFLPQQHLLCILSKLADFGNFAIQYQNPLPQLPIYSSIHIARTQERIKKSLI